jgi:hypothetical protein
MFGRKILRLFFLIVMFIKKTEFIPNIPTFHHSICILRDAMLALFSQNGKAFSG